MVERDINFKDPVLEEKFQEAMQKLGPAGRVKRSLNMLSDVYNMLAHLIATDNPGLSEREVRRRVALRLYRDDKEAVRLLEELA